MKKLLFLIALAACGDSNVKVGGTVYVKHQIDLNVFEEYYREICEATNDSEEEIVACVEDKMDELIETLLKEGLI